MVPWREAWHDALYGPAGFFVTNRPRDHFRTSVTASPLFAEGIHRIAAKQGLRTIVDLGAGGGELLAHLHAFDPELELIGVDLAARPDDLPAAIRWLDDIPETEGMLIANEWLDNIPCEIVELDDDSIVRAVLVDPTTGHEELGDRVESEWLDRWWRLPEPGLRAEIGEARDEAWAEAVSRVHGFTIAVDYGHLQGSRPPFGSLSSFAGGFERDVIPNGSRDVTAHVAVDAVAQRVGGNLERQGPALTALGLRGDRPPLDLAKSDPPEYLRRLGRASEAAELRAPGGLGDFWWIVADTRVTD